jgi:alpha-1,2-mannosyltransferase
MTAAEVDRESRTAYWVARLLLRRRSWWMVAAAVVFAAVAIKLFGRRYIFFDMAIYHGAVEWWLAGGDLYEYISPSLLGFTYPPFAAVAMLPMAAVPPMMAGWINVIASVAVLGAVLAVLMRPLSERFGWPRWPTVGVALALAIATEPVRETLGFGQVNLLLFGLVMADLLALRWAARAAEARRRGPRGAATRPAGGGLYGETLRRLWYSGSWAGVGIGLATAVKLTPGLFILYLLISRQRRPALVASATAAGASLLTWLVAPTESGTYFGRVLWQTDRVGAADFTPNQSLAGLLARLYDSVETPGLLWMSFAALCCAVGLSRAVSAHKDGDELASFTLVGLTATVISPISWSHHLVFVIPALVILGDAALRRRVASRGVGPGSALAGLPHAAVAVAIYIVFVISPIWWYYHRLPLISHYAHGVPGVLAENSLALGVIVLVAMMPWRPGAAPAPSYMTGWQAWMTRRPALGSSGSTVAARSRTSSPAAQTAGS